MGKAGHLENISFEGRAVRAAAARAAREATGKAGDERGEVRAGAGAFASRRRRHEEVI